MDDVALRQVRDRGEITTAQMFEIPAPCPGRLHIPEVEERFERSLRELSPERLRDLAAALDAPEVMRTHVQAGRPH